MWFWSHRAATPVTPVDTVSSTPTATRLRRRPRQPKSPRPPRRRHDAFARRPRAAVATPTPRDASGPNATASTGSTIPAAGRREHGPRARPARRPHPRAPTGRAATPTPTPRPASPAIDAAPVVFNDVKYIRIQGDKGDDLDARLIFGGGVIQVLPRNKDQAFTSEPYRGLARATYVRAKNPKWDQALAGPPLTIDLSGFLLKNTRHWLVLQSKTTYVILRLDDSNWQHDSRHVRNADGPQGRSAAEHGQVSGRARDVHSPLRRPRCGQGARAAPGVTLIGRLPTSDLMIADASVSRRHASLRTTEGKCFVQDAASRFGTFVNGARVQDESRAHARRHAEARRSDVHARAARARAGAALRRARGLRRPGHDLPAGDGRAGGGERRPSRAPAGGGGPHAARQRNRCTEILNRVVDVAFEAVPAERAFLMLRDSADEGVSARVLRHRDGTVPTEPDAQPAWSCGA